MKVLVVDDDRDTLDLVSITLKQRWPTAEVTKAETAGAALTLIETAAPDLVILDIILPDFDGREVLKRVRRFSDVPIIMLTGRDKAFEVADSLEEGADDYVTKPFSPIELLARIQAVLRRAQGRLRSIKPALMAGDLLMDFDVAEVFNEDQPVNLTPTEMKILELLVLNAPRVVSYDSLSSTVLGVDDTGSSEYRLIRVHVQHLRSKLGDSTSTPKYIANVPGLGYRFMTTVTAASRRPPQ